ncbi:hypothetical protein [Actinomyces weissii]|uniref:Uncharacterized protein n=1 Tax=Actinomyces weissii TaxID=675090 RepID=A0A7T7M9F3_9ACTO|nr:hypothetical protein [Actinomyces weissii]QQM67353.1 hypothetical protein JG540_00065 [Actinomyces weissii]
MSTEKSVAVRGPSAWYPALHAVVAWAVMSAFMLTRDFPWWSYAASGLIFLVAAYFWDKVINKGRFTSQSLIAFASVAAVVLLACLGLYLWV